jgi:hypothetical protein
MGIFSRNFTAKINWCLDNLLPPVLRDAKWLCRFVYGFDDGANTERVIEFKAKLPELSDADIGTYYDLRRNAKSASRPTDINDMCLNFILESVAKFKGGGGG